MTDDWITCPTCKAEGEVGMEWIDDDHFVPGSGSTCPTCEGAMCFEDQIALDAALAATEQSPEPEQEKEPDR